MMTTSKLIVEVEELIARGHCILSEAPDIRHGLKILDECACLLAELPPGAPIPSNIMIVISSMRGAMRVAEAALRARRLAGYTMP